MMSDGFAWTIPLIQVGFGTLFLAAHRAGAAAEARHWGTGFMLNAAAFAAAMTAPWVPGSAIVIVADVLFACAFYCFGSALVARYGKRDRPWLRKALLVAAIVAPPLSVLTVGTLRAELLSSDLGCAAQILVPLALLVRWPHPWIDRWLIMLSWLVVGTNLCRTMTAPLPGGAILPDFPATAYSYLMYADGIITGCAFAILALIAVTKDLFATYRRDAHVDPLTGLLNRRGFEAAVGAVGSACGGGVISWDLDHFKRVNDSCGHEVGDRVLTGFAGLVRAVLPPAGIAARVGGEEFILYLPGLSILETEAIARASSLKPESLGSHGR